MRVFNDTLSGRKKCLKRWFLLYRMNHFAFLVKHIEGLSDEERQHNEFGYILKPKKERLHIEAAAAQVGIDLPVELIEFYQFSYGALLGEYEILTVEEIAQQKSELQATYESAWQGSILPIVYVRGVGDVIAMDMSRPNQNGEFLIFDGFHELPSEEWESICYGFRNWLVKMVEAGFQPFWLITDK